MPLACLFLTVNAASPAATETGQHFGALCSKARIGDGVVRILHFGDSHLGGMEARQEFSRFFHTRYGDGGLGLGLPWVARKPGLTAHASQGWLKTSRPQPDGRTGLAGMCLETRQAGEWAELEGPGSRLSLHLARDPSGGRAAVTVDNVPLGEIELSGERGQLAIFEKQLPRKGGIRKVEIRCVRSGLVRILGVALEEGSGAVYSPLPCNGARLSWMISVPEALFKAQVEAASPDMIILSFGTNESNVRGLDLEAYRKDLATVLARFRKAAPQAALVLGGPPDGVLKQGDPLNLERVIAVQKAEAAACNALFLDQRLAMGGPGSIETWLRQGWAAPDRVHMTAPGYQHLARFCLEGILAGTGQAVALAALPPAAPAARAPRVSEPNTLYSFRNQDGRVFITDNPAKVKDQPGQWIQESPR